MHGFARWVQKFGDIDEIHFRERSSSEVYDYFFTNKLGAKHIKDNQVDVWIWKIPDHLKQYHI